ncbi:MAG TPA: MFS transporter [Rubricoccaceae bacterium]|nr:MFS transporter [Rubricoccaceae bacterium]
MHSANGGYEGTQHVRRNFVLNVADGALFAFGLSFVARTTMLPLFVQHLGGGNLAVGLLPVLWTVGFHFPQLAIAHRADQAVSKKRLVLATGLGQRLPWLLLAVVAFLWLGELPAGWALAVFFGLYALAAVGGSLNLPGWFDLVAKLTPVRLRGRLFAVRAVLGSALGVAGGWIVAGVLARFDGMDGFAVLFGLAFLAMAASYVFIALLREVEDPACGERAPGASRPPRLRPGAFLRRLPEILRTDRNYRRFLVADALLTTTAMADAFYTVYAFDRFGLSPAHVGVFTVVVMATGAAGGLLFGWAADRVGHRLNLALAALGTLAACAAALWAPSPTIYLVAFAGSALALGLPTISRLPLIAELCGEAERPTYVALTNTLTAPFALAGLLGGWLADAYGYEVVFVVAAGVSLAAAVWLLGFVREPRRSASPSPQLP